MWLRERFKKPACHLFWSLLDWIEEMGHALMAQHAFRLFVVGVWFEIARVLILLLEYTGIGQQWMQVQLQTASRITHAVNMLLLQRHINMKKLQSKPWEYMMGPLYRVILRAIGRRLVEATGESWEAYWFRQNLAITIQWGNKFSILSASRERFWSVGGVELQPTPHFIPEGISSSMSNFIILVLIFKFLVF